MLFFFFSWVDLLTRRGVELDGPWCQMVMVVVVVLELASGLPYVTLFLVWSCFVCMMAVVLLIYAHVHGLPPILKWTKNIEPDLDLEYETRPRV